jgi:hypothetical protein
MTTIHRPDINPLIARWDFMMEATEMNPDAVLDANDQRFCEYLLAGKMSVMQGWMLK